MFKVAIIGRPNVGKTTLFNLLTGKKNKVGNWDGVTIDIANATLLFANEVQIIDLPGLVSLNNTSQAVDQNISKNFLLKQNIDLIINVISSNNLAKDLYLTLELYSLKKQMLIVTFDEIEMNLLDIEIICINLKNKGAIRELIKKIQFICNTRSQITHIEEYFLMFHTHTHNAKEKLIEEFLQKNVKYKTSSCQSNLIDQIVMHKLLAFPIFFCVICLILFCTIIGGEYCKNFFEYSINAVLLQPIINALKFLQIPCFIVNIFQYGIGVGITIITSFIPILMILYTLLGILEESGYIARVSKITHKFAAKIGLSGRSIIPLIIGLGCNVPAIVSTRIIENAKQRLLTIILIPFMSCGARLTILTLFASLFFADQSIILICSLYFFNIFLAMMLAIILKPDHVDKSEYLQPLPQYRIPNILLIMKYATLKIKNFAIDSSKTIISISCILYLLAVLPDSINILDNHTISNNSVLIYISKKIQTIVQPIGITENNWPATVSLIMGVLAKEVVASTLISLSNMIDSTIDTSQILKYNFQNDINAFAYIIFVLIYFPCISVFAVISKETSTKIAIITTLFYTILAYIIAFLFRIISINMHTSVLLSLIILTFLLLCTCLLIKFILKIRRMLIKY